MMKRLMNISCFACFVLAAALVFLTGCGEKKKATVNRAPIEITSDPEGASITVFGKVLDQPTPYTTKPAPPGVYVIKVEKDGYQPEWKKIVLKPGQTAVAKFQLNPIVTPVLIVSKSENVSVEMNDQKIGDTPILLYQKIGEYNAVASKTGYSKLNIKWSVANERPMCIRCRLKENQGFLSVVSDPSDARIYIDGTQYGVTPCVKEPIESGAHSLVIKKEGYRDFVKSVLRIESNKECKVKADLMPMPVRLVVESEPVGASVEILNVKKENAAQGVTPFDRQLPAGVYTILLKMQGFDTISRTVELKLGDENKQMFRMASNIGSLTLTSVPAGASVSIRSAAGDVIHGTTPFVRNKIAAGDYTVRVEKRNFLPETRTVKVVQGDSVNEEFALRSALGSFVMTVHPPGVSVYLDGKLIGKTVAEEGRPYTSKPFTISGVTPGKHVIKVYHQYARPKTELSMQITARTGETIHLPRPLDMWVPNALLKEKEKSPVLGKLIGDSDTGEIVVFETDPGIRLEYKRSSLEYVKRTRTDAVK